MTDYLKSMRWTLFTTGGILILLGIVSCFHPLASLMSFAFFIGIGFVVAGINHLVPYFTMRGSSYRPSWLLPQGILDILLGVLMLTRIGLTTLMIPVLLGFWVMFMGVLRLYSSFQLKRAGLKKWWILLISGVLLLLCALMVISSPILGALLVTWLIGAMFICAGAAAIAEGRLIYPPK